MRTRVAREVILERLRTVELQGTPILGVGCSAGIIAKCAEAGGADLLVVYSTGKSRLMGLPTTRLGDSNALTLTMAEEILNVVRAAPVIGGVEATDPTRLDLPRLLARFVDAGYSGVINFPTIGIWPDQRRRGEKVHLGFQREVDLIRLAREADVFTMAYVGSPRDAEEMVAAGADCLVAHMGPTEGGLAGFVYEGTKEEAAERAAAILRPGQVRGDVICLIHGGPITTPADTAYIYARTGAFGFVAASGIERIAVEEAVITTTRRFKRIPRESALREVLPPAAALASGVHHFSLCVSDIERSLGFYAGLIGCTLVSFRRGVTAPFVRRQVGIPDAELAIAFLDAFGHTLELIEYQHPRGAPTPPQRYSVGAAHVAFAVTDAGAVYERLRRTGVEMVSEPQALTSGPNKGGFAFYALDPDGITVEIFQTPVAGPDAPANAERPGQV